MQLGLVVLEVLAADELYDVLENCRKYADQRRTIPGIGIEVLVFWPVLVLVLVLEMPNFQVLVLVLVLKIWFFGYWYWY